LIRKANIKDAKAIQGLLNHYASKGLLLPRPLNEIFESIRDFFVYEEDGEVIGVSSLHINWEDLAEIRSLAVKEGKSSKGIGTLLVKECLSEAESLEIKRVYALTYSIDFFKKQGFKEIDKNELPQKVWRDCIKCVKFPDCDETAFIYDFNKEKRQGVTAGKT
jgi:amino-acid N-acetyltransferase